MANFITGILIGLLFGVPVGVIGVLTIHKSITKGIASGLFTGLGSSVADVLYGIVGCFGTAFFSDFVTRFQSVIASLGSIFVISIGISLILSKKENEIKKNDGLGGIKCFLTSFVIGITNPVTIVTFFMAFAMFGVKSPMEVNDGIVLVSGIFTGTYFWWIALSVSAGILKNKLLKFGTKRINFIFGIIVSIIGIALLVKQIF